MAEETKTGALPTEADHKAAIELRHFIDDNQLKGQPYYGEDCKSCHYYLNPDENLSYCWHPKVRIAVGGPWWCQWWEETLEDDGSADELPRIEPKEIDEQKSEELSRLVDAVSLKGVPNDDQRCDNCHYYHMDPANPDMSAQIAYCWHAKLRILVGADWWCERWAKIGEPEL